MDTDPRPSDYGALRFLLILLMGLINASLLPVAFRPLSLSLHPFLPRLPASRKGPQTEQWATIDLHVCGYMPGDAMRLCAERQSYVSSAWLPLAS
jgi:hypothetical protein